MRSERLRHLALTLTLAPALVSVATAQVVLTQGTNITVDASTTGDRLVIDLLGSIWVMPSSGGQAEIVSNGLLPARRPRWSPDGRSILYQADAQSGAQLWLHHLDDGQAVLLSDGASSDQHGAWHPDGQRIAYSTARRDSGLDIWEMDLKTGLSWRITGAPGDDTEPVWSGNGRHLAFIRHLGDRWSIFIRRFGRSEAEVYASEVPLTALSWRPDGSLVTYLKHDGEAWSLYMLILSDPPIERLIGSGEDFFLAPVSWRNRQHFFYTADGIVKSRRFEQRQSRQVAFTALVGQPAGRPPSKTVPRDVPLVDPPSNRLVIRGRRLFDGVARGYRPDTDVVITNGRIEAVARRRDWGDVQVLDLGDVTVLPGFVDAYSAIPQGTPAAIGAQLLSYGLTTVITDDTDNLPDAELWESEAVPGPRVLRAGRVSSAPSGIGELRPLFVTLAGGGENGHRSIVREWQDMGVPVLAESWNIGLGVGAELLLGADTLPTSPQGLHYQDIDVAVGSGPLTLVSGLADAGTPGLDELFESRQARLFGVPARAPRRFTYLPRIEGRNTFVVLGSKPNGLPPGLAFHAELRALQAAGLRGDQVLRAAGANPAGILGLEAALGRVVPGALADLVLVSGDPLDEVADSLDIVAVVRNGRFYSLVNLLERATKGGVE